MIEDKDFTEKGVKREAVMQNRIKGKKERQQEEEDDDDSEIEIFEKIKPCEMYKEKKKLERKSPRNHDLNEKGRIHNGKKEKEGQKRYLN